MNSRIVQMNFVSTNFHTPFSIAMHHWQARFGSVCNGGNLTEIEKWLQMASIDPAAKNNEMLDGALYYGQYPVANLLLRDARVAAMALDMNEYQRMSYCRKEVALFREEKVYPMTFSEQTVSLWADIPNIKLHLKLRACAPIFSPRARTLLGRINYRECKCNQVLAAFINEDVLGIILQYANMPI